MARDIRVKIVGDDSSFQSALKRANLSAEKTGSSFTTMGKHIVGGLAAFAGVSVGVGLLEESVRAAQNAETAHALLAQQMKNVGLSFKDNAPEIEHFTEALSKMSGFTGTELTTAFTGLVRVTKDVGKAQDDLRIAVDLARLKHIDLAAATSLVTKAQIGMVGGLRRVGIDVHAVTTNVDELRAAHDKAAAAAKAHGATIEKISKDQLDAAKAADKAATSTAALAQLHKASAGAAEAYGKTSAGAMERFKASVEHLQVELGSGLLPVLALVAGKAATFVDNWGKAGTTANDVKVDVDNMVGSVRTLAKIADGAAKAFGGWNNVLAATKDVLEEMTGLKSLEAFRKIFGGLFSGGGKGQTSAGAPGSSGAAGQTGRKGKDQSAAIVAAAQSQLGIAYQWGGPAILGQHTDCSGLAQAVLAKAGIHVGRTTYEQWTQGKPTVQPQPGDLVFFHMGSKGPEHVGVYIGNDQFIEDPHTGSSVRVSKLSTYPGYCGARTYVAHGSGGGSAPTGNTDSGTSPTPSWKSTAKKAGAVSGFQLPVAIRTALSAAGLTKGTADDMKALAEAKRFIEAKLGSLSGDKKIEAMDALKGINDSIQSIEDAAHAKQIAKLKEAHARQQAAWKAHLERLKAAVTAQRSAFESAFTGLVDRAMAGFDRATAAGLAAIQAQYGAQTPEEKTLADFQAKRAADDLAKSRADALANASTDEERAALALGFSLDDQEAALKTAADASRTAADKQAADATSAYQDLRDLQKTQLQAWLDDQEKKLESGKTQWADFWKDLVKRAGMAGADTASAFWQSFAAAGASAQGASSSLSAAQVAAVVTPAGSTNGGSSTSGYVVGGVLIQPPKLAAGGIAVKPTLAMIGEAGPEAVIPLGRGGGFGGGVTVNMYGPVGSEEQFAENIRRALLRKGIQTGRVGLS